MNKGKFKLQLEDIEETVEKNKEESTVKVENLEEFDVEELSEEDIDEDDERPIVEKESVKEKITDLLKNTKVVAGIVLVLIILIAFIFLKNPIGEFKLPSFGKTDDFEETYEPQWDQETVDELYQSLMEQYPDYEITILEEFEEIELEKEDHYLVYTFDGNLIVDSGENNEPAGEVDKEEIMKYILEHESGVATMTGEEYKRSLQSLPQTSFPNDFYDDDFELERQIVDYAKLPVYGKMVRIKTYNKRNNETLIFEVPWMDYVRLEDKGSTVIEVGKVRQGDIEIYEYVRLVPWE